MKVIFYTIADLVLRYGQPIISEIGHGHFFGLF